jgi:hypothetical protein
MDKESEMSQAIALGSKPASAPRLRRVLAFDAATCLLMGMVLLSAAAPLSALLGLPESLVFWAGAALLPCAGLMAVAAALRPPPPLLVWVVILGNAAWIAASVVVTLVFEPTWIGVMFVVGQAAAVLLLLVLEQRARASSSVR